MNLTRFFQPLFFAFILLFAQQAGVAHALNHALEDLTQKQKDKQAPNSVPCEKCADYAQLGSALNVGVHDFVPLLVSNEVVQHNTTFFRSIQILAADARGPPQLQTIA